MLVTFLIGRRRCLVSRLVRVGSHVLTDVGHGKAHSSRRRLGRGKGLTAGGLRRCTSLVSTLRFTGSGSDGPFSRVRQVVP